MVTKTERTAMFATIMLVKENLKTLTKWYGRVQCSEDNPMISLREVEKLLAKIESKMLDDAPTNKL